MRRIFNPDSPYKTKARYAAWLWTLLLFIGCLTPGKQIPRVSIPFIDKWTHFVMFGVFSFLWLCARPERTPRRLTALFFSSVFVGALIEVLQGTITSLGRSMELMDGVADAVGGAIGIGLFCGLAAIFNR